MEELEQRLSEIGQKNISLSELPKLISDKDSIIITLKNQIESESSLSNRAK
jgi:hypothetical protein